MSILTEEERLDVYKYWLHSSTLTDEDGLIQIAERAVLEKLARMELPPVPDLTQEEKEFLHYNPNTSDLVDFVQGHAAAFHQAYAQGAASQLSAEPIGQWDGEFFDIGSPTDYEKSLGCEPVYTLKATK